MPFLHNKLTLKKTLFHYQNLFMSTLGHINLKLSFEIESSSAIIIDKETKMYENGQ